MPDEVAVARGRELAPWWQPAGLVTGCEHHLVLGSTNDHAREVARGMPREAVWLVLADQQLAGRGRGANRWWTGEGSLALSILFDPAAHQIQARQLTMIPLAAALAVIQSVRDACPGHDLGLHWPNDVFLAGRKLSGVLVEGLADGRQILGLGLNVNNSIQAAPPEVRDLAISLADMTGGKHERWEVLRGVLSGLADNLTRLGTDPEAVAREADGRCLQKGRLLTVVQGSDRVHGRCLGIAPDGALLLEDATGTRAIYSGVVR